MTMKEFRELLLSVDRSYDDFVSLVISFVKMPENKGKAGEICDYIRSHPFADSGDVLKFMVDDLGLAENVRIPELEAI